MPEWHLIGVPNSWPLRTLWNCVFSNLSCPQTQAAKKGQLIRRPVVKCHIIIYEVFNNHSTIIAGSGGDTQLWVINCTFECHPRRGKGRIMLSPSLLGNREAGWVMPCHVGSAPPNPGQGRSHSGASHSHIPPSTTRPTGLRNETMFTQSHGAPCTPSGQGAFLHTDLGNSGG